MYRKFFCFVEEKMRNLTFEIRQDYINKGERSRFNNEDCRSAKKSFRSTPLHFPRSLFRPPRASFQGGESSVDAAVERARWKDPRRCDTTEPRNPISTGLTILHQSNFLFFHVPLQHPTILPRSILQTTRSIISLWWN